VPHFAEALVTLNFVLYRAFLGLSELNSEEIMRNRSTFAEVIEKIKVAFVFF